MRLQPVDIAWVGRRLAETAVGPRPEGPARGPDLTGPDRLDVAEIADSSPSTPVASRRGRWRSRHTVPHAGVRGRAHPAGPEAEVGGERFVDWLARQPRRLTGAMTLLRALRVADATGAERAEADGLDLVDVRRDGGRTEPSLAAPVNGVCRALPRRGARGIGPCVGGSARGGALDVVGVVSLDPGESACAARGRWPRSGAAAPFSRSALNSGRAGVLVVDEALGEGAVLDVGEDGLHVLLDVRVDDARAGDVVAVLGRVGDRPALLGDAALDTSGRR